MKSESGFSLVMASQPFWNWNCFGVEQYYRINWEGLYALFLRDYNRILAILSLFTWETIIQSFPLRDYRLILPILSLFSCQSPLVEHLTPNSSPTLWVEHLQENIKIFLRSLWVDKKITVFSHNFLFQPVSPADTAWNARGARVVEVPPFAQVIL